MRAATGREFRRERQTLRRAMSQGRLPPNDDVGAQLADVVIAAAILARQLGAILISRSRRSWAARVGRPSTDTLWSPCINVGSVRQPVTERANSGQ